MQSNVLIPHGIKEALWLAVAIILASLSGGGGYKIIELLINRGRPKADIHAVEARAARDIAEGRAVELQAIIASGDSISRMVSQLTFAHIANEKLHQENLKLKNINDTYEKELRWAKAIFRLKGLKWEPTKEDH